MHAYWNVEINIFSIILMIIVFTNMHRRSREYLPDQKMFLMMVISNTCVLVFDTVQWVLDGIPGQVSYYVNLTSNTLYYLFEPLPIILWCYYVRYQIKMDAKEMLKASKLLLLPFFANVVLSILSFFFGYYFTVNHQNYYQRGEFFWVSALIIYCYFLYTMIYLLMNRKKTEKSIVRSLLFFTLPPILGSTVQLLHFGIALIWPSVTLSLIIIYLNIQKNQLYTDHLTGLYNRRLLDIHLNDCLKNRGSIGVIMLDIDKFKQINDAFGHVIGDQALVETASILKKSVGRNGFTARYGGDEFVIVIPDKNLSLFEGVAKEIEMNIEQHNEQDCTPYEIHLSMGLEIFDCNNTISKYEILYKIDRQMYEGKFRERAIENQMTIQ